MKRRVFLLGLLLVGVAAAGIWSHKKIDKPVMQVGDYAITQKHLALYEEDLRPEVGTYFYETYQQDPGVNGFWDMRIQGETPSQVLREEAVNALLTDTVERIEASRYEIEVDITLADIEKSMEDENKWRIEPGDKSYGVEKYSLMEYISTTQKDVREALKRKLLESRLKPTKEQLEELYDRADAAYLDKGEIVKVGAYMSYGKAESDPIWLFVREELNKGTQPEAIIEAAGRKFTTPIDYMEVEYDPDILPINNEGQVWVAWVMEKTYEMSAGECSEVLDYGTSQGILKVLYKTDLGKASFEEAEALLAKLWIDENYPGYLDQCIDAYR